MNASEPFRPGLEDVVVAETALSLVDVRPMPIARSESFEPTSLPAALAGEPPLLAVG